MSDRIHASHILIMHADSQRSTADRTKEEALLEIERIKAELDDGGDFGELAKNNSDCPSGADQGSLGEFGRGQMAEAFETAAFALDVGADSGIVETPFGYHLIRRTK